KQRQVLKALLEIRELTGIPLIASNDCHYAKKSDHEAHDARLCISTARQIADANRLKFESHEFYFKSPAEMADLFSFAPEALENTLKVADMCNVALPMDQLLLPRYDVPQRHTQDSYLEELCAEGLKRLGKDQDLRYQQRLKYEISTIMSMGFSG